MFPSGSFAVTLQCSHQCDHSVPGSENLKRTQAMFRISTFVVSMECYCSVPLLASFGDILGTRQAHLKCSKFCSFPGMCLQCPQNSPKFYQKWYAAGTLPGHCKCTDLEHLWYTASVLFKFPEPGTL